MGWMRFAKIFVLALIFGQVNQCFAAKNPKDAAAEAARALRDGSSSVPHYMTPLDRTVGTALPRSRLTAVSSSVSYDSRPKTRASVNPPQVSSSSSATNSVLTTRLSSSVPPQSLVDGLEQRRVAQETGFDARSMSSPASIPVPEPVVDESTLSAQRRVLSLDDAFSDTLAPSTQRVADLQQTDGRLNVSSTRNPSRVPSARRRERRDVTAAPVSQPAPADRALVEWLGETSQDSQRAPVGDSYSQKILDDLSSISGSMPSSPRYEKSGPDFLTEQPFSGPRELDRSSDVLRDDLHAGAEYPIPLERRNLAPIDMPSSGPKKQSLIDRERRNAAKEGVAAQAQLAALQKLLATTEQGGSIDQIEKINNQIKATNLTIDRNRFLMEGDYSHDAGISDQINNLPQNKAFHSDWAWLINDKKP